MCEQWVCEQWVCEQWVCERWTCERWVWQDSIRHMQELRGGWWQYGEGGGGGMERVAAVAHRGLAEGKGRWHASVGRQHIRVGGTYHGEGHTDGIHGSTMEALETHWWCVRVVSQGSSSM